MDLKKKELARKKVLILQRVPRLNTTLNLREEIEIIWVCLVDHFMCVSVNHSSSIFY